MAKKQNLPEIEQKTILIKPRSVFSSELTQRIEIGDDFLKRDIKDINQLKNLDDDYDNWDDFNLELIKRAFNKPNSEYYHEYHDVNNMVGVRDYMKRINTDHPNYKLKLLRNKIYNSTTILKRLVDKLPLIDEQAAIQGYQTVTRAFSNNTFIVHGHNEARKFEVARFLENDLKKKALILHERPNKGRTLIEKFENYSFVDFAVALWTSDDLGKAKTEEHLRERARQNVIFETGYFIGKLGRQNVIVIYEGDVEIPSDYSGIIFIRFSDNWKDDLRKEINAIYYEK